MHTIDLNCDMGEGAGNDEAIMPYISSANIACGYHAGDEETMKKTVELAMLHNVAVGAHPGFADRENFGRLEMHLPLAQIYNLVTEQLYRLQKVLRSFGGTMRHVKPHGALYNMAAKQEAIAATIAKAVRDADEKLILYGLYNSFLVSAAHTVGLQSAGEVFADRRYNNDGSLVSRQIPGAVIENENLALGQVLNMVLQNSVTTIDGETIAVHPQTICLHGDGRHAAAFARTIYDALVDRGIKIQRL